MVSSSHIFVGLEPVSSSKARRARLQLGPPIPMIWFVYISSPQQDDLRLPGPQPGQGASGGARTLDRRVPADLRLENNNDRRQLKLLLYLPRLHTPGPSSCKSLIHHEAVSVVIS
ncbi:hypothetical protein PoB_000223800 [Plakobranchus ocellatus]|uniref:Uncharacterized protein n=1 Tax=Plakobranchus ocellatus TaxID=259542 RepID=A0AAV3XZU4_9GAST|nr:hypothetical protein PoB_000223800 [Plakobranchus ocellatus]